MIDASIDRLMYGTARRGYIDPRKEAWANGVANKLSDIRKYEEAEANVALCRALAQGPLSTVGEYFIEKYRTRAAESGFHVAASQLRKQGVPLGVALLTLLGTNERPRVS